MNSQSVFITDKKYLNELTNKEMEDILGGDGLYNWIGAACGYVARRVVETINGSDWNSGSGTVSLVP